MYLYRNSIPAADVAVRMAEILNTTVEHLVAGRADCHKKETPDEDTWRKMEIQSIVNTFSPKQLENFLKITRACKDAFATDVG